MRARERTSALPRAAPLPEAEGHARSTLSGWIAPAFLGALGVAMLAWTWGRWLDPQIDFGGEIYVAWRIAEGDVLYRDLAYFTGPLSPYLNGLWLSVFGASLRTLVVANLAILLAIVALLHRLLDRVAGRGAATAGCAVFLTLFAFAQLEPVGNSNYVAPYSHETTHGALLALVALALLARWLATRSLVAAAAAGFVVGLSFLTKVEVFLAISAAVATGLALGLVARRERALATLLSFALAASVPALVAFALLVPALGGSGALHGTLGAWRYVVDERITTLPFYARILGTDKPGANLARMLSFAARDLAVVVPALALGFLGRGAVGVDAARTRAGRVDAARTRADRVDAARTRADRAEAEGSRAGRADPPRESRTGAVVLFAVVLAAVLALRTEGWTWMEVARPWPLFTALALVVLGFRFARRRTGTPEEGDETSRSILRIAFAIWALVLLAKMVLNTRIQMYGFALAMPATMLVVAALVGWLPAWIGRRGGSALLARAAVLGVIAAAVVSHLSFMRTFVERATVPIGRGADAFRADLRARLLSIAQEEIERRSRPGATVLVLPEGVMLNYLARRATPARYINYMPPELLMFGEGAIVADLAASPPDLVVVVTKSTAEYGVPFFGRDYGREIWSWVGENYVTVFAEKDERIRLEGGLAFGVQVLEPKAVAGAAPR